MVLGAAFIIGTVLHYELRNAKQRFFLQSWQPVVSLNDMPVDNARAYRSIQGIWLIDMGNETEWYVYLRQEDHLLTCNVKTVARIPGALYFVRDETLPCVPFSEVMAFNPHRLSTSNSIEFDSHEHRGRVRLTWPD